METTPSSFKDESLLSAALDSHERLSIDNKTLFQTPAPLAASTVARSHGQRLAHVQGSFLEDSSSATVSSPAFDGEQSLIKMESFSNNEMTSTSRTNQGLQLRNNEGLPQRNPPQEPSLMNRSSLGILPIDNMEELSSSILRFETSPEKRIVPGSQRSLQNEVIQEVSDDGTMMDVDMQAAIATAGGNRVYNLQNDTPCPQFKQDNKRSDWKLRTDPSSMRQYTLSPRNNLSSSYTPGEPPFDVFQEQQSRLNPFSLTPTNESAGDAVQNPQTVIKKPTKVVKADIDQDVCGGKSMDVLNAAAARGGGGAVHGAGMFFSDDGPDPDASVHEVRIEADELEQFDDEFSDVGEFDNTVTDEISPPYRTDGQNPLAQPTNLFETPHPFNVEGDSLFPNESNMDDEGPDEVDVRTQQSDQGYSDFENRPGPYKVTSFSLLQGQQEFEDFKHSEFSDLIGKSNNSSFDQLEKSENLPAAKSKSQLGEMSSLLSSDGDPGFERAANQGEGQEEEDINNANHLREPSEINAMYFRQSPHGMMGHADGEESITEDGMFAANRSSIAFDAVPSDQQHDSGLSMENAVGNSEAIDSINSSEIDTEDEVEAVRREMRATFMRSDEDSTAEYRPELDSFNQSVEQDSVRQSAEGVVQPPLAPGDGDGQDNEELQSMIAQQLQLQQMQSQHQLFPLGNQRSGGGLTTYQFLQGLGILGATSPEKDEEQSPEELRNDERVKPMGDETNYSPKRNELTASAERRVRFASPTPKLRDRTLSGASVDDDDDYESSQLDENGIDSQPQREYEPKEESLFGSKYFNPSEQSPSFVGNESVSPAWGLEHSTFNLGDLVPSQLLDNHHQQKSNNTRQVVVGSEFGDDENEEPEVDQEFNDQLKKITEDFGADTTLSTSEKMFIEENSPVYINELGEGVTDLAYQVPLREVAENPFDGGPAMQGDLSGMFGEAGNGDFGNMQEEFSSGEFVNAEKGLAMIDRDEVEFEKENIFIQDEAIGETSHLYNGNQSVSQLGGTGASSLGLPDSWSFHTHVDNISRPSWMSDTMDSHAAYHRISIGAFMMARTEALGSLDGNHAAQRPAFGSNIVTPPSDRKPVALYEKTSPSTQGSIDEGGSFIDNEEDVRGAGVGSDSEHDREVTDLDVHSHQQEHQSHDSDEDIRVEQVTRPKTPEELLCELIELSKQESKSGSSTPDRSMANVTGALDLSEITRIITAASANAKPKELTEMILKMSQNKKIKKYPDGTKPQQEKDQIAETGYSDKLQKENNDRVSSQIHKSHQQFDTSQNQPQLLEAHFNGKPITSDQMAKQRSSFHTEIPDHHTKVPNSSVPSSKVPTSESSNFTSRIPADGKSERRSSANGLTKAAIGRQQQGKMSTSNRPTTKSSRGKQKDDSTLRESSDRDTLTNTYDRHSGSRDRDTLTDSRVNADLQKQSQKKKGSVIDNSSRRSGLGVNSDSNNNVSMQKQKRTSSGIGRHSTTTADKQNIKQSNLSQRDSIGRTSVTHGKKSFDSIGAKKGLPHSESSKNTRNKNQSLNASNADRYEIQKCTSVNENYNINPQPSTPKSLVLREKDFSRDSPLPRKDMGDAGVEIPDNDVVWRSPRPSSVMSRTSKQDSSFENDRHYFDNNNCPRPLEPDGAQYERSYTPPVSHSVITNSNFRNNERQVPGIDENRSRNLHSPAAQPHSNQSSQKVKRLSSTPVRDDQLGMTLGTQDTFSHIVGLSPNRRLYDDSQDTTLTSEDNARGSPQPSKPLNAEREVQYGEVNQSTPVRSNHDDENRYRRSGIQQSEVAVSKDLQNSPNQFSVHQHAHNINPSSLPLSSMNHHLAAAMTQPTLLTNQPLSRTAFANQYLNSQSQTRHSPNHLPSSWKSATAPVDQIKGPVTSFTGADVHVKVASELRIPEVCCVGLSTHSTLTLTNPTQRWLHVALKLVSLSMDGQATDMTRMMPFVMKEKVIVEPNSSEEVKVIFAPRQAGVYVGQLHVVASPVVSDQPLQPDRVPAMVTVQALAEKPHVQILTADNSRMLDFGAIPWGCHKGVAIALVNRGRASVPIRLVISSHKSHGYHANCFTFERYTTGDTSLISNKVRPSIPSMSPCVVNYTLHGTSEESSESKSQEVMVFFVAPCRQVDRGYSTNPEEFTAKLDLEVDTPSSLMNLGSIILRSVVGTARLHAPSSDLDQVTLKADLGKFQTHIVPLRNAGNIPIDVSLEVTHFRECFATVPMQLMIEPGGQSEVTIKFEPKESSPSKLESLLILLVEPDGPSYEIPLLGERTTPQSFSHHSTQANQNIKNSSRGPQLLSNKHFLSWGGVPLRRANQQTLTLKNVADQMLKLRLEIRATHENFQIQSLYGDKERLSMSKEIIMKPLEQYPVHVLFAPTKVVSREAKLVIRVVNTTTKYTIPLSGYGGISKLVMEEVQPGQNSNYWVGVGTPEAGKNIVTTAVLRNIGNRAAYVKCVGFHDLRCKSKLIETRITFQPEEFCIKEKQTQQVTVIFHPNDDDVHMCQEKASIVTTVACFYGDEVSRQQLRRAVQKYGTRCLTKCPDDSPANGIKFHIPFEGEDLILEGEAVKDSPNDVDLFYNTMSKMMLAFVGEPTTPHIPEIITSMNSNSQNLQIPLNIRTSGGGAFSQDIMLQQQKQSNKQYCLKAQDRLNSLPPATWEDEKSSSTAGKATENYGHRYNLSTPISPDSMMPYDRKNNSPPEKDGQPSNGVVTKGKGLISSDVTGSSLNGNVIDGKATEWTVHPQQLVLSAPTNSIDPLLKHVQLFNFTERPLTFDLSWPAHCITISPEQGMIGPKKSAMLSVSANVLIRSKGVPLPWSGKVHITCNGQTQILKVQIREGFTSEDSYLMEPPQNPSSDLQPSLQNKPLVSVTTPLPSRTRNQTKAGAQQIGFMPTYIGKTAETEMEITNLTAQPIKWMLSSFTPPYLKTPSADQSVLRVTYSAFWLPKQLGLLRSGESTKVQVCFQPKESGLYSQHWELKSEVQVSVITASYSTKLEFYGEGIEDENKQVINPGVSWTDEKLSISSKRSGEKQVETANDPIELKCERIIFPDTGKSETHKCKLEMKNRDKKPHTVVIVAPKSPFHVRHVNLTIKSRHFVRVPIEFSPKKPGYFQAELIIKPDSGQILTVPLIGRCPSKT